MTLIHPSAKSMTSPFLISPERPTRCSLCLFLFVFPFPISLWNSKPRVSLSLSLPHTPFKAFSRSKCVVSNLSAGKKKIHATSAMCLVGCMENRNCSSLLVKTLIFYNVTLAPSPPQKSAFDPPSSWTFPVLCSTSTHPSSALCCFPPSLLLSYSFFMPYYWCQSHHYMLHWRCN